MELPVIEYGLLRVRDLKIRKDREASQNNDVMVTESIDVSAQAAASELDSSLGEQSYVQALDIVNGGDEVSSDESVLNSARRPRKAVVSQVCVKGEWLRPTPRFWRSFFHRFGITDTIFRYFDHEEVFSRIAKRAYDDSLRFCIERQKNGVGYLLSVSNPTSPILDLETVMELLQLYKGNSVTYQRGIVTSTHTPRSGEHELPIGADMFRNRYVLDTPIDGFGRPQIHLSLMRLLCSNGAVGYAPAFRSEITMGKHPDYSLARAMDGYDNGEGYAAFRQRFQSAQTSWASLREGWKVYRTIGTLPEMSAAQREALLIDLSKITGDMNGLYGLANPEALSVKRQRVLPIRCRVYDLLNFVSEVATHHAQPDAGRILQGIIGEFVSDEYDLEGTAEKLQDFDDFLIQPTVDEKTN